MPSDKLLSDAVRRVLARDDLLMMARDAEVAVGIVRAREHIAVARAVENEQDLFSAALDRQLAAAAPPSDWSSRSQALVHAATIIRFCGLVGIPLKTGEDPARLYEQAVRELLYTVNGTVDKRDLTAEVAATYRRARDLRLAESYDEAQDLASRPDAEFFGTGAEPHRADYQYEVGACLLLVGEARQVAAAIGESEKAYWQATRAGNFVTRQRFDFILGLAAWETGNPGEATRRLAAARTHLDEQEPDDPYYDVQRLSLALASAEQLAAGQGAGPAADDALALTETALEIAERIRGRWSVIARSRSPLAVVFRRIYGDIALLASTLPGQAASELGLRIALSAKQTGFASRMRTGRALVSDKVYSIIEDIVDAEQRAEQSLTGNARYVDELDELKRELLDNVSPMLADTVLPAPANVGHILAALGGRYALDFVSLPDTLADEHNWFRTLVHPDGTMRFEHFTPGEHVETFFHGHDGQGPWLGKLMYAVGRRGPNWRGLAAEVLPRDLIDRLAALRRDEPVDLVVSAHSSLSLLPWAALVIDDRGTRLVERAVIAQTPVLTCLDGVQPQAVNGPALVRLVPGDNITVGAECAAWGLREHDGRVPLSECRFGADPAMKEIPGRVASALRDAPDRWGFVHVASHGGGQGLDQHLKLPERLSAGEALTVPWPPSVLMASCHVGRLFNIAHAEPLSFVMALLTGGSRCVIAAMDSVADEEAGKIAATIARHVRGGRTRLDVALREAQVDWVERPVYFWALFSAYVR